MKDIADRMQLEASLHEYRFLYRILSHPPGEDSANYKVGFYEEKIRQAMDYLDGRIKATKERLDDDFDDYKELRVI